MEEIVHIVPLGWERSRAVEPIKHLRGHRAYLLCRKDHILTREFMNMVEEDLKSEDIEVKEIGVDETREFDSLVFHMSKIILWEHERRNRVHINISASGKVASAASFIVGAFHSDKVASIYYVRPSKYTVEERDALELFRRSGLTIGFAGLQNLRPFQIERPNNDSLVLLAALYEKGPLSYMELVKTLKESKVEPFVAADIRQFRSPKERRETQRDRNKWIAKLKRLVLNELIRNGYVSLEPSHEGPKRLVKLTQSGRDVAIISGLLGSLK